MWKNIEMLGKIDEYEGGCYMTHYPYLEISRLYECLYEGMSTSEEEADFWESDMQIVTILNKEI